MSRTFIVINRLIVNCEKLSGEAPRSINNRQHHFLTDEEHEASVDRLNNYQKMITALDEHKKLQVKA